MFIEPCLLLVSRDQGLIGLYSFLRMFRNYFLLQVTQFHDDPEGQRVEILLGLFNQEIHKHWIEDNPQKRPLKVLLSVIFRCLSKGPTIIRIGDAAVCGTTCYYSVCYKLIAAMINLFAPVSPTGYLSLKVNPSAAYEQVDGEQDVIVGKKPRATAAFFDPLFSQSC